MLVNCPTCAAVNRLRKEQNSEIVSCDTCQHSFVPATDCLNMARVTLTRTQIKDPKVQEFAELLLKIAADGVIEYDEMVSLSNWLNEHKGLPVPAVSFMFGLMFRLSSNRTITANSVYELQIAIERVLPKEFRLQVKEKRQSVYYSQPASDEQLRLLYEMTGQRPANLTRRAASEMLENIFNRPSNRQMMLLRFWNRMDMANKTRDQVTQWIDQFSDSDKWEAWSKFKKDYHDNGEQNDPTFVPIGIGEQYLKAVTL